MIKFKSQQQTMADLFIFTSEMPENEQLYPTPKTGPFLIISLHNTKHNYDYLKKTRLSRFGIIEIDNCNFVLTIQGDHNVNSVIERILKDNVQYPETLSNGKSRNALEEFKKKLKVKQQKKPPITSKLASKYAYVKIDSNKTESANPTCTVKKKNKLYIFKQNISGRPISELETANSFCYDILLGNQHAQVRSVHNDNLERIGVISKMIPNFKTIHDMIKEKSTVSIEDLLDAKIAYLWVAAFVEEENDLHGGNYGFSQNKLSVKIDNDQSTWPLTCVYAGFNSNTGMPNYGIHVPRDAFTITKRDIENFPKLIDAKPINWPDRSDSKFIDTSVFKNSQQFHTDKYYMFLKRILIPDSVYQGIGNSTIRSDKLRKKFVTHKCERTHKLTEVLMTMPEFIAFIKNNPNAIEQLKCEFNEYNNTFKKEKYRELRVDINDIESTYNHIKEICRRWHTLLSNSSMPNTYESKLKPLYKYIQLIDSSTYDNDNLKSAKLKALNNLLYKLMNLKDNNNTLAIINEWKSEKANNIDDNYTLISRHRRTNSIFCLFNTNSQKLIDNLVQQFEKDQSMQMKQQ